MKIIVVDKLYYPYSGPQDYFFNVVTLLRSHGHTVIPWDGYAEVTSDILNKSLLGRHNGTFSIGQAMNALYSFSAKKRFGELLDLEKPDIVFLNNIYHALSPSLIDAARARHITIVYWLHDYKLACPRYRLFVNGNFCQSCKNGNFFQIFKNRCSLKENGSVWESLYLYIESILHHKILHIYKFVNTFVAPSRSSIQIYKNMGFPYPIFYLPTFVFPKKRNINTLSKNKKNTIVYVGRLVPEKGVELLLRAVVGMQVQVFIIGAGIQEQYLQSIKKRLHLTNVTFLGFMTGNKLDAYMRRASCVVVPSLWEDPAPKTIIESFAFGTPVIGSSLGGIKEMVVDGKNGYLCVPGDIKSLRLVIEKFCRLSQKEKEQMGNASYETWEDQYNPDMHYQRLMKIFSSQC